MDWTDGELEAQVQRIFWRVFIVMIVALCALGGLFMWKLVELAAGR